MARPRTIRDEDLLAATARVVDQDGPLAFTLQAVADEAGVSAPLLLQRFETKRGLLLALAESSEAEVERAFERAAGSTPLARLESALILLARPGTPRSIANGLAFLQLDVTDPSFRAAALRFFGAFRARVELVLAEAVRARQLKKCDTGALARAVEVAYNGSILGWALRQEGSLDAALRHDVRAVLAAYLRT